jgi:hypothetical protein
MTSSDAFEVIECHFCHKKATMFTGDLEAVLDDMDALGWKPAYRDETGQEIYEPVCPECKGNLTSDWPG